MSGGCHPAIKTRPLGATPLGPWWRVPELWTRGSPEVFAPRAWGRLASRKLKAWNGTPFPHAPTSKHWRAPPSPEKFAPSAPHGTERRTVCASAYFFGFLSVSSCVYCVPADACSSIPQTRPVLAVQMPLFLRLTPPAARHLPLSELSNVFRAQFQRCSPPKCFLMLERGCELSPSSTRKAGTLLSCCIINPLQTGTNENRLNLVFNVSF